MKPMIKSNPMRSVLWSALLLLGLLYLGEKTQAADEGLSITNTVPRSIFRELPRDPFLPIGYVKPQPKSTVVSKPVDFKLRIVGISMMGSSITATLDSGEIIEVGGIYQYKTKEGSAEYKVLQITEDSVVVQYDQKEYTFKISGADLEQFKEKEESP